MVEFPRDNKERWSWASPARTLGLGPAVPGVWRGSRELSCCTEPTWSWCMARARAGRQRWAKPRRARVPRVSARGQRECPVHTAGAGAGARGGGVGCAQAPVLAASPAPMGLGTSACLQRRVATVTARRGRCQTTARSGQRTNAGRPGENNSPAPPKQALDQRAALRRARLGGDPLPSCLLRGAGTTQLPVAAGGGEPRGPIWGSRAAFPEQRDGGRGDGRGLVRRAGVPRAGLEGAGGEQHPARPGHGAVGEGCPAGDRQGWGCAWQS